MLSKYLHLFFIVYGRSLLATGDQGHRKAVVKIKSFLYHKHIYVLLLTISLCAAQIGLHRYIFLTYKQPGGSKITLDEPKLATIATG